MQTVLEKGFLTLSNQHWLRSWHLRRSLDLTVVTATLSWALLVDAIGWNSLVGKPPLPDKVSFIEGDCLCKQYLPLYLIIMSSLNVFLMTSQECIYFNDFTSVHLFAPLQWKHSTLKTLVYCSYIVCSNEEHLYSEL